MSLFDQRGQHVNYQYNAAGDINFGNLQNAADLAGELEKLKRELTKAREGKALDEDTETVAKAHVVQAAQEAKAPQPDKKSLLDHLASAKSVLEGILGVNGIVEGLTKAYEWVHQAL